MSEVNFIKKITVKNVCGKIEPPKQKGKSVPVMRLFGLVTHYDIRESQYGPSPRFKGQFEALSLLDKSAKPLRSGTLYVPEVVSDMILAAFPDGEIRTVQFAVEIGVKADDSTIGYQYEVRPLIHHEDTDPLANVRALALEHKEATK